VRALLSLLEMVLRKITDSAVFFAGPVDVCSLYGSVLPRAFTRALIGCVAGVTVKWCNNNLSDWTFARHYSEGGVWYHPYSLHVLGMVLGFSLVMRIQIAYQRFWEGTTQCHQAAAKWGDAAMQIFAFDEASKDAFSETALEFRMLVLHFTSLMTACALIDIRKDDDDLDAPLTFNHEDPYLFRPKLDSHLYNKKDGTTDGDSSPTEERSQEGGASTDGGQQVRGSLMASAGSLPRGGDDAAMKRKASALRGGGKASGRLNTVPLQMLLVLRRQLQKRYETEDINSFEPVQAKDKAARPASYASTTLDLVKRVSSYRSNSINKSDDARRESLHPKVLQGEGKASKLPRRFPGRSSLFSSTKPTPSSTPSSSLAKGGDASSDEESGGGGSPSKERHSGRRRDSDEDAADPESSWGGRKTKDDSTDKLRRGSMTHTAFFQASVLMRADKKTRLQLARANCFDVIGGVTQSEIDMLEPVPPGDRAFVVQTWIVRLMTNRLAAGGLAIPPPLLSRTYQVLSDGTAAAAQARKVSYVSFPFPLRQLLVLLLWVFIIIAPITISSFMRDEVFVGILSFFVCLGYTALNEAAREIEHPFGLGANHLALCAYQRQFNSKLARLFDQSIPSLGYVPGGESEHARMQHESAIRVHASVPSKQSSSRVSFSNDQPREVVMEHQEHTSGCTSNSNGASNERLETACAV